MLLAQTGREKDKFNRVTAIEWLSHFIPLGRSRLAPWYPSLVATLLRGLSDTESELVKEVGKANADLMALVRSTPRSDMDGLVSDDGSGIVRGLLRTVRESLGQTNLVARSAALRWLAMLLQLAPDAVEEHLDQVRVQRRVVRPIIARLPRTLPSRLTPPPRPPPPSRC